MSIKLVSGSPVHFGSSRAISVIGGPVCDQIAREARKRSERLGNASDNIFSYKK